MIYICYNYRELVDTFHAHDLRSPGPRDNMIATSDDGAGVSKAQGFVLYPRSTVLVGRWDECSLLIMDALRERASRAQATFPDDFVWLR